MAKIDLKMQPPLIQAILKDDLARVKQLLAEGADPNTSDTQGRSALNVAEYKQEIAVALIEAGADLRKGAKSSFNPVWAVGTGRLDILRKVLDAGGDMNCRTMMGTPLHVAARTGQAEMVRLLIELGADINAGTSISNPITDAIERGHPACALLLLKAGARPKIGAEYDQRTLLTMAAHAGQAEVVEALLAAGAPPDQRGKVMEVGQEEAKARDLYANGTPLMIAASRGDLRSVDALLNSGAKPALRDEDGNSPLDLARKAGHTAVAERLEQAMKASPAAVDPDAELLLAAERGDAGRVRDLLAAGKCDVNARDTRSRSKRATPLLLAARGGHSAVVRLLLEAGADPSLTDAGDQRESDWARRWYREINEEDLADMNLLFGRPALSEAAPRGDRESVSLLLAKGAEVDQADVVGVTPLMRAAAGGHADVVRALLDAGANPNAVDCDKSSALAAAVNGGSGACVEMLLSAGAKLPTGKKQNLVMRAAQSGHADVLDVLLRHGAKVDAVNSSGETPLMAAAEAGHIEVVRRLLSAGADVNHRDNYGNSALMNAAKPGVSSAEWEEMRENDDPRLHHRVELCRLLLDAGADVNVVDNNGFTPLGMAIITYNDPLARFLLERGANPNLAKMFDKPLAVIAREHECSPELIKQIEQAAKTMPAQHAPPAKPAPEPPKERAATRGEKRKAKEQSDAAPPDFSAALQRQEYLDAVADLEKRCGTKAIAFEHAPGAFHLHVDSRANFNFDQARGDLAARGFTLVWLDTLKKQRVGLFPTGDVFQVLLAMGTNGANYDFGPGEVVASLKQLHSEQPFEITGVSFDTVEGRFLDDVKDPKKLARRMYKFCPDIVDQGIGSVAELAKSLEADRRLFLWWD